MNEGKRSKFDNYILAEARVVYMTFVLAGNAVDMPVWSLSLWAPVSHVSLMCVSCVSHV